MKAILLIAGWHFVLLGIVTLVLGAIYPGCLLFLGIGMLAIGFLLCGIFRKACSHAELLDESKPEASLEYY